METHVHIRGQRVSVRGRVVEITKSVSPLPGKIVGAGEARADVISDKMAVASDRALQSAGGNLNADRPGAEDSLPIHVTHGGTHVFTGNIDYEGSSSSRPDVAGPAGTEHRFRLLADGGLLFPMLEGRTLRELDLGTAAWNDPAILRSWADTADDQPGIFAPAVYGDIPDRIFTADQMRYHVYFLPIVRAIFEQLAGYRVESTFFETDYFKACAHTYGVGDAMETFTGTAATGGRAAGSRANPYDVAGQVSPIPFGRTSPGPSLGTFDTAGVFTVDTPGAYIIRVGYDFTGNLEDVDVMLNDNPLGAVAPPDLYREYRVSLNAGDEVAVRATAAGSATLVRLSLSLTLDAAAGASRIIRVATCLPNKPVKDFLRGIAHLFNLEFGPNHVLRTVRIEPRFPYVIDGVEYPGFYDLTDVRPLPGTGLAGEVRAEAIDQYPAYLELGFADTAGLAQFAAEQSPDPEGIPYGGVRFGHGEDREVQQDLNPYFTALRALDIGGISRVSALPHLWEERDANRTDDDADGIDDGDDAAGPVRYTLRAPTYEYPPSCGLVQRSATTILWNRADNPLRAPLLAQNLPYSNLTVPAVLSYGDEADARPGSDLVATVYPGVGSIFYQHLAATLLKGRTYATRVRIPDPNEVYRENFRQAVALRPGGGGAQTCLLLSLSKYQPGGTAQASLLSFVAAGAEDRAATRHYAFAPLTRNPEFSRCDYLLEDTTNYTDDTPGRDLTAIRLKSGFVLPLSYPYNSEGLGETARLRGDLEDLLTGLGFAYAAITVTAPAGAYRRWSIALQQTDLWLAFATISGNALHTFDPDNCTP